MTRLVFIVPAYNEERNIGSVVEGLKAHFGHAVVVVVNDGSTDATVGCARAAGASILQLPFNLGIGGAVQSGLLFASRGAFDVAVQFDGDGQHLPGEVAKLLTRLSEGDCDVVIGSRFLGEGTYKAPVNRRIGIGIFSLVNSIVLRKPFTDTTSGFRAFNRAAIEFLSRDYPHDFPEPESIVTLTRNRFRVVEVQVEMKARQGGRSSITFLRSLYYVAKVMIAILIGATRRPTRGVAHEHQPAGPVHLGESARHADRHSSDPAA